VIGGKIAGIAVFQLADQLERKRKVALG